MTKFKLINTKEIKTITQIDTYEITPVVTAVVTKTVNQKTKSTRKTCSLQYTGKKLPKSTYPVIVKDLKLFTSFCQKLNPFWNNVTFKGKKYDYPTSYLLSEDPRIKFENIKPENIILMYSYNHMLFDNKEEIIPLPILCSYINGNFDSSHYDLDKLLPHLKSHKSVLQKTESEFEGEYMQIVNVPHYNNPSGTRKHINFIVIPDKKMSLKYYYDNWKENSLIDYLGIKKFKLTEKQQEQIEDKERELENK